jgi:hypothetical protein
MAGMFDAVLLLQSNDPLLQFTGESIPITLSFITPEIFLKLADGLIHSLVDLCFEFLFADNHFGFLLSIYYLPSAGYHCFLLSRLVMRPLQGAVLVDSPQAL